MPEAQQEQLPLEQPKAPNRFVIPDEPVVNALVAPTTTPAPEAKPADSPEVKTDKTSETKDTGTSATPADPEAKPEKEDTPEQLAAKRDRRAQNKLEKAYRVRAEAQAKADVLEKRLADLESKSKTPAPIEGEPTLAQFDYDPEKYATAKAEFAKTQAAKEIETKQRTEAQKLARQNLLSSWQEKAERGSEKYDDWEEVVGEIEPNTPWSAAMMKVSNADDVAHYLGQNKGKEAHRISILEPLEQVLEIGLLSAKLLSKPVEPKVPSKAPAPITPVAGTAANVVDGPAEQDDTATWIKKRQKQVHGRR